MLKIVCVEIIWYLVTILERHVFRITCFAVFQLVVTYIEDDPTMFSCNTSHIRFQRGKYCIITC